MRIYAPISLINDNPFQKRQHYGEIDELAADIRRHKATRPDTLGLQQVPSGRIVFRSARETRILTAENLASVVDSNGRFAPPRSTHIELEFGHRRLRALRLLAETDLDYAWVPLNILPLSDEDMLNGVWSENEARKNLSDVERAELIRVKLDTGLNQQQVADAWGLSRSQVSWLLGLLSLPDEVKAANRIGELPGRTAYALRDVVNIADAVNGASWIRLGGYYNLPAPADYIQQVLAEPEKYTSDAVRNYVRDATLNVGTHLPDVVAKFDCAAVVPTPNIIQRTCYACKYRTNDICVKRDCAATKKELVAAAVLESVSAYKNLPISQSDADFVPSEKNYDVRNSIKAAWAAGISVDWVIKWADQNANLVRPFAEQSVWSERSLWQNDGMGGIAIAPRGGYLNEDQLQQLAELEAAENGTTAPVANIAGPAQRAEWERQAKEILAAARERLAERMVDALYLPVGDAADVIQAAIAAPQSEWIDDHERFTRFFVKFLLTRGAGVPSAYRELESYDHLAAMSIRAGLGALELSPPDTAVMLLRHWYDTRDYFYTSDGWQSTYDRISALLDKWPPVGSGEALDNLRYELGRAQTDAKERLAELAAKNTERDEVMA